MTIREFVKSYQVPSGKDWLIDKEDVVVNLIEEYIKSNRLEKLATPTLAE